MIKTQKPLQRSLCFLVFSAVLLIGAIGMVTYFNLSGKEPPTDKRMSAPDSEPSTPEPASPTVEKATARWLLMGDVFLGRAVNSNARESSLGVAQPFSKLDTFQRENYTDWIANLECPVTNNGHDEYMETEKLIFNCDPDYLPELQRWFSVVSLANNHTDNQGSKGFLETKRHLTENNIQYFGTYDRYDTINICNVVRITTLLSLSDGTEINVTIPFGFCGYHLVLGEIPEKSLQEIAKWSEVLPVIAVPHSGIEYQTHSNQTQETTFRKMIDLGADMVIGSHPHVVQNTEFYKDKLIVYSLGNFIFDQWKAPYETFSAVVDVSLEIDGNMAEQWSKVDCDTLETCKDQLGVLEKITPKYTFDFLSSSNSSKITEKGDQEILEAVLRRLQVERP